MPSYTIPLAVAARLDSGRYMSSRVGLGQLLQHAVTPRGGKERGYALAGGVHAMGAAAACRPAISHPYSDALPNTAVGASPCLITLVTRQCHSSSSYSCHHRYFYADSLLLLLSNHTLASRLRSAYQR